MVIVSKSDVTKFFAILGQSKKKHFSHQFFLGHHLPPPRGEGVSVGHGVKKGTRPILSPFQTILEEESWIGCISLCLVVFGGTWLYFKCKKPHMKEGVVMRRGISWIYCILLYLVLFGFIRFYLDLFGCIWLYLAVFGDTWLYFKCK